MSIPTGWLPSWSVPNRISRNLLDNEGGDDRLVTSEYFLPMTWQKDGA